MFFFFPTYFVCVCLYALSKGHIFRELEESKAVFKSSTSLLRLAKVTNKKRPFKSFCSNHSLMDTIFWLKYLLFKYLLCCTKLYCRWQTGVPSAICKMIDTLQSVIQNSWQTEKCMIVKLVRIRTNQSKVL